jgi:hypothetical protein
MSLCGSVQGNGVEQAQAANLGDLGQCDGDLVVADVREAGGEAGEDAVPFVFAGADDERDAKFRLILGVEAGELGDLVGREVVQSGGGLLGGGGGRERSGEPTRSGWARSSAICCSADAPHMTLHSAL